MEISILNKEKMEKLYRPVQLVFLIFIIFILLSQFDSDGAFWITPVLVFIGVLISSFFFYGSYFYFFSHNIREIKNVFLRKQKFFHLISSLLFSIPFGLTGIIGIFYVLKWPGIILLYIISIVTLGIAILLIRVLKSRKKIDEKHYVFILKNMLTLTVILILLAFVLSFDLSDINFDLYLQKGPKQRIRH